ncbi:MAG: aspartate kinase [Deltaproteobacteria bacterium]|nr:MAG: aspartate kinase [Deltaproteobacteria bacterium]
MIVMKFGGSSVADRTQIEKVRDIVRAHVDQRPFVVCSAHKGITDGLQHAARAAAAGHEGPYDVVARQRAIARELEVDEALIAPLLADLEDLLRGIRLVGEVSPRSLDHVLSFGERMSVRVIADFLRRFGTDARAFDAWDLGFVTDDRFGRARPLPGFEGRVRRAVDALDPEVVPVVTGFVGKTVDGVVTTVGRNGSDLTATLFGAALGAERVQIWSDTDGVMTADPSVVPEARNIPAMLYDEAAELAFFGSRVLHPTTLLPAMEADIPVHVRNTNRPDHPGTVISRTGTNDRIVTSIAYKEGQTLVTVRTPQMFEAAGFLADLFGETRARGVVVDVIATSEISVSFTVHHGTDTAPLAAALEARGHEVVVRPGCAILVVVGHRLRDTPGIGARILGAMAKAGVNVEMVSYAHGSISFSMIVPDADVPRAVPVLHDMFFADEA